jgi:outer membrane immunogenic protein
MNKLLLGTMMTIALAATAATAADMPVKAPRVAPAAPAYDWSGIYVGVGAGGTWSDVHRFYPLIGNGPLHSTSGINDAIYNIHAGAQWQWGRWVLGVEVGYSQGFSVLENKVALPAPPLVPDASAHDRINSLFTVGPRLGFAWDRWMIYGTGGFASAELDGRYAFTSTGAPRFPGFWGESRNKGWFAGAGFEVVVLQGTFIDLLLGAEYQHFDLRSKQTFCFNAGCNPANPNDFQLDAKGDIFRARLTFKTHGWPFLGSPVVARY